MSRESDCRAAVIAGAERFGRIDVLVNNVGVVGPAESVVDIDLDDWRRCFEVNVTSMLLMSRHAIPRMRATGGGSIVNVSSIASSVKGIPNRFAYGATKAGVIGLTKSLGKELATSGVLVNCVAPAVVKTELFSQMTEQHINYMLSKIPMNRFGEVEEVAEMVAWLASPLCTFATGATFDLSGGRATY